VVVSRRRCRLLPSSSITWLGSIVAVVVGAGVVVVFHVLSLASMKQPAHIPLGRGGAQVGLGSEAAYRGRRRWWKTNPHPSIEGRGSLPDGCGWFRASCGGEGGGEDGSGGGGMRGISTVMGLMTD
jgi:hypothetical protein